MNNIAFALPLPYRTVAAVTALALLAWTLGLPAWIHHANAATNVNSFSDTLSDSDLGVSAVHTLKYTLTSAVYETQTIRVTFDPTGQAFNLTGLTNGDIAITALSGGTITQVPDAPGCSGIDGQLYVTSVDTANDYIQLTMCSNSGNVIATSTVAQIVIGNTHKIANPSNAGSYVISLGGTNANTGDTRVAIIDDVTVTAAVDTIFNFTINGVNAGTTVGTESLATIGTSTATTVPFGTLPVGTARVMAQRLTVATNAINGFAVSVFADHTLTAGNGATIDEFANGSPLVGSTTPWSKPTAVLANPDTWGHWGLTSDDTSTNAGATQQYNGGNWYRGDFTSPTTPVVVFSNGSPVTTNAGVGVGSTTVAYKVEISALQEAAKDYTATLTYIATPVF